MKILKKNILISAVALVIALLSAEIFAADSVSESELPADLTEAYKTKSTLSEIDDESSRNIAEAELKAKFLQLGCSYQASENSTLNNYASLCFVEAALLDKSNREIPVNNTQASVADSVDYDYGTMKKFLTTETSDKMLCIFSVDGGGIRGIIPALYFEWIEEHLKESIINVGDLFAGTSVGGILTSGVNCPQRYPASKIVELFEKNGNRIFPHSTGILSTITAPIRYVLNKLWHSHYSPQPLEELLDEYFKEGWLNTSAKPLLVTSIQTTSSTAAAQEFFFSSIEANKPDKHGENYRFKDICRATSAATTYFPAARIESYDHTPRRFVDAGLTINNPARLAYEQAKKTFPNKKIIVFSFGTGRPKNLGTIPADSGEARSASPLISNMMDINSEQTHFWFSNSTFTASGDGYVRVQCELGKNIDLDDVSQSNLDYLKGVAESKKDEIQLIAKFLKRNQQKK